MCPLMRMCRTWLRSSTMMIHNSTSCVHTSCKIVVSSWPFLFVTHRYSATLNADLIAAIREDDTVVAHVEQQQGESTLPPPLHAQ
jgi:hypothetical protein